jgi:hypothetical protein
MKWYGRAVSAERGVAERRVSVEIVTTEGGALSPEPSLADAPTTTARPRAAQSGSPLAAATRFRIPIAVLNTTLEVVREAGQQGCEAFVTWGGHVSEDGRTVTFQSCLVPRQTAHTTPRGLLVTVEGLALFELNQALYQRGELLAAQVHSHPQRAYHSDTDDCFSLVTLTGALSVVIPNFGRDDVNRCKDWAFYRLTGPGTWSLLDSTDQIQIVHGDGS